MEQDQKKRTVPFRDEEARKLHNVVEKKRKDKINYWIKRISTVLPLKDPHKESKIGILERAYHYIDHLKLANDEILLGSDSKTQNEEVKQLRKKIKELKDANESYIKLLRLAGISACATPNLWTQKSKNNTDDLTLKSNIKSNDDDEQEIITSDDEDFSEKPIKTKKQKRERSTDNSSSDSSNNNGTVLVMSNPSGSNITQLNLSSSSQLRIRPQSVQIIPNGSIAFDNTSISLTPSIANQSPIILGSNSLFTSNTPQQTALFLPNGQLVSLLNQPQQVIYTPETRLILNSSQFTNQLATLQSNANLQISAVSPKSVIKKKKIKPTTIIEPVTVNLKKSESRKKIKSTFEEKCISDSTLENSSNEEKEKMDSIQETEKIAKDETNKVNQTNSTDKFDSNIQNETLSDTTESLKAQLNDKQIIPTNVSSISLENDEEKKKTNNTKNNEKNSDINFFPPNNKESTQNANDPELLLLDTLSDENDISGESVHSVSNSSLRTFLSLSPSENLSDFLSKESGNDSNNKEISDNSSSQPVQTINSQSNFVSSTISDDSKSQQTEKNLTQNRLRQTQIPQQECPNHSHCTKNPSSPKRSNSKATFESQPSNKDKSKEFEINHVFHPSNIQTYRASVSSSTSIVKSTPPTKTSSTQQTPSHNSYLPYSAESLLRQPSVTLQSYNVEAQVQDNINYSSQATRNPVSSQLPRPAISYSAERLIHSSAVENQHNEHIQVQKITENVHSNDLFSDNYSNLANHNINRLNIDSVKVSGQNHSFYRNLQHEHSNHVTSNISASQALHQNVQIHDQYPVYNQHQEVHTSAQRSNSNSIQSDNRALVHVDSNKNSSCVNHNNANNISRTNLDQFSFSTNSNEPERTDKSNNNSNNNTNNSNTNNNNIFTTNYGTSNQNNRTINTREAFIDTPSSTIQHSSQNNFLIPFTPTTNLHQQTPFNHGNRRSTTFPSTLNPFSYSDALNTTNNTLISDQNQSGRYNRFTTNEISFNDYGNQNSESTNSYLLPSHSSLQSKSNHSNIFPPFLSNVSNSTNMDNNTYRSTTRAFTNAHTVQHSNTITGSNTSSMSSSYSLFNELEIMSNNITNNDNNNKNKKSNDMSKGTNKGANKSGSKSNKKSSDAKNRLDNTRVNNQSLYSPIDFYSEAPRNNISRNEYIFRPQSHHSSNNSSCISNMSSTSSSRVSNHPNTMVPNFNLSNIFPDINSSNENLTNLRLPGTNQILQTTSASIQINSQSDNQFYQSRVSTNSHNPIGVNTLLDSQRNTVNDENKSSKCNLIQSSQLIVPHITPPFASSGSSNSRTVFSNVLSSSKNAIW